MIHFLKDFPDGTNGGEKKKKKPACLFRRHKRWNFRALDQENPLEKEMATYSGILAWRMPWTEKPGRRQSIGSQRVGLSDQTVSNQDTAALSRTGGPEITDAKFTVLPI